MASQPAPITLLHRFLGMGLILLGAVSAFLKFVGVVPLLPPDDVTRGIAYTTVGIAAVLVAVALLVLKPRVPERPLNQPAAEYWATPAVAQKALQVWFATEGAGVFSIVGYMVSGEPVSAIAAGLAVIVFWLFGPMAFAKA